MNIDELLRDTFAAHEHLAPDDADVLAAVRRRTGGRRVALTRPLAVAASVALVAAAGGGAVALSNHHDHRTGLAQSTAPTGSTVPPSTSASTSASASAPNGGRTTSDIMPLTMPFDLGWLPRGSVDYVARRVSPSVVRDANRQYLDGEYLMTVTTGGRRLDVDVQQFPLRLSETSFKSGGGRDVTVNGRRGIESVHSGGPGGYEIYFLTSAGGLMYVNVGPDGNSTASAAEYTSIGRRVARGVRFPGTAQVTPTFGLRNLPDGLRVLGFDVESLSGSGLPLSSRSRGNGTSYDLGTSTSSDPSVDVGAGNVVPQPGGRAARPVQGHATRYVDQGGYRLLEVRHAVLGQSVVVQGRVPLAELYAVARGLVLPS